MRCREVDSRDAGGGAAAHQEMPDRKYRQRGYQDDDAEQVPVDRARAPRRDGAPRSVINRQHGKPNLPAFHEVMRCARCGDTFRQAIGLDTICSRCRSALHTCAQCVSFDSSQRFECAQQIQARVSPKDERNECTHFSPQVTVERQTKSHATGPRSAKQVFDDLFK